jgi:hypothetical protein
MKPPLINTSNNMPLWLKTVFLVVIVALSALGGWLARGQLSSVDTVANTITPSPSPTNTPNTSAVIKMLELGIEITVPASLKDLTYEVEPLAKLEQGATGSGIAKGATGVAATLSTTSLAAIDNNCAASTHTNQLTGTDTGGAIGSIYRIDGAPDNTYGTILLKTDSYFVIFQSSQSGCSQLQSAQQMQATDKNLLLNVLSTPNALSLIK